MIESFEELEKKEIRKLLKEFDMPTNWLGIKFIITAIPYTIDIFCSNEKIVMKELYKFIAKKHKTTASKVECAIRYVCENTDIANKLNKTKVTNQRLILIITDRIMNRLHI